MQEDGAANFLRIAVPVLVTNASDTEEVPELIHMNLLFIRSHFMFSVKNSNTHLFYHLRRNILSLGMHFIDPHEEGLFNFRMHSPRFPLSVWIYDAFVISM